MTPPMSRFTTLNAISFFSFRSMFCFLAQAALLSHPQPYEEYLIREAIFINYSIVRNILFFGNKMSIDQFVQSYFGQNRVESRDNKWVLTGENGWSMRICQVSRWLLIDQRIISFASICKKEEKYRDKGCSTISCFSCQFFHMNSIFN